MQYLWVFMQYFAAFLAIIVLIIVHEFGHYWVAKMCKMKVEKFSIFFGRPLAKFTRGGTVFQIGTVPLGGYVQITGMNPMEEVDPKDPYIYPNRPAWQRVLTIFAGPAANYVAAVVILFGLYLFVGLPHAGPGTEVGEAQPGTPAAAAGLREGDLVVSVDGRAVTEKTPLISLIEASGGKAVKLSLRREGQYIESTIKPFVDENGKFRIGVRLQSPVEYRREGVVSAAVASVYRPIIQTKLILGSLAQIFTGKEKAEVSSPIRIVGELGKRIKSSPLDAIGIVAMLSVFLGLFNLLPIPALDGGRLVFLGVEVVSRRRVNQRIEASIHMVGFVLLLGLMVFAVYNDIRFLGAGGGTPQQQQQQQQQQPPQERSPAPAPPAPAPPPAP